MTGRFSKLARFRRPLRRFTRRSSSSGSECGGTSSGLTGLLSSASAKPEQHLRQFARRLQPVRARAVVPLLVAIQFYLQTQILDVQIVGALLFALLSATAVVLAALLFGRCLFFDSLPLRSRSPSSRGHHRLHASLSSGKLDSAAGTM